MPDAILVLAVFLLPMIPAVLYVATLHGVLAACAPANRRLAPGLVWLQLVTLLRVPLLLAHLPGLSWIPGLLGLAWQFVVVIAVSRSAGAELRARGIPEDPSPRLKLGLWMAGFALAMGGTPPPHALLFGIPFLILWVVYWIRMAGIRRLLIAAPPVPVVPATH